MSATSSHKLYGLEPDNLLAFLALLGLLRALEMSRPDWKARAYWDLTTAPIRPVLVLKAEAHRADISAGAQEGLLKLKQALLPFSWPRAKDGSVKKAALLKTRSRREAWAKRCLRTLGAASSRTPKRAIWRLRCDILACCGATRGGTARKGRSHDEEVDATPLKLPSGQMSFIGGQYALLSECRADHLLRCLFAPWRYEHKGNSLRLSPDEARRYAYRASNPAPEGSRTELGASALACLGLLSFVMSDGPQLWRMVAYKGTRSEGKIAWPIHGDATCIGASRHGVDALLRSIRFNAKDEVRAAPYAEYVAAVRRYVLDPRQGDYGNITWAQLRKNIDELGA